MDFNDFMVSKDVKISEHTTVINTVNVGYVNLEQMVFSLCIHGIRACNVICIDQDFKVICIILQEDLKLVRPQIFGELFIE